MPNPWTKIAFLGDSNHISFRGRGTMDGETTTMTDHFQSLYANIHEYEIFEDPHLY